MCDNVDLKATLDALAKDVQTLQASVEANSKAIQAITSDRLSSLGSKPGSGGHHNDRLPKFKKMEFPHNDGRSHPLIFINHWESYFHQQRIIGGGESLDGLL
jgi:hypothetical protein